MPETFFQVRWPDGQVQRCYSPSTVVEEHLAAGTSYPMPEFVARSRTALEIASERVRAKFGFACSSAADQLAEIETTAAAYHDRPDATVTVEEIIRSGGVAP